MRACITVACASTGAERWREEALRFAFAEGGKFELCLNTDARFGYVRSGRMTNDLPKTDESAAGYRRAQPMLDPPGGGMKVTSEGESWTLDFEGELTKIDAALQSTGVDTTRSMLAPVQWTDD